MPDATQALTLAREALVEAQHELKLAGAEKPTASGFVPTVTLVWRQAKSAIAAIDAALSAAPAAPQAPCRRQRLGSGEYACDCIAGECLAPAPAAPQPAQPAAQAVAPDALPSVWSLIERYADAVYEYNAALRIDVSVDKFGAKCLAIEKQLRAALAAAPAVAPPAVQPLTLDQISDMDLGAAALGVCWDAKVALVRAVERAHKIGGA